MDSEYTLNPQAMQDSLIAHLRDSYPHIPVIEDGMPDEDYDSIETYFDGSIKPFIVVQFGMPRRARRGRAFAGARLDQRICSADIMVVGKSGTEARRVMNSVADETIGFKTDGGGVVVEADRQLWTEARKIDTKNRPSRWVIPLSVEWGAFARKIS